MCSAAGASRAYDRQADRAAAKDGVRRHDGQRLGLGTIDWCAELPCLLLYLTTGNPPITCTSQCLTSLPVRAVSGHCPLAVTSAKRVPFWLTGQVPALEPLIYMHTLA